MSIIRLCYFPPKFLILTEHFTQRQKISPGLVCYKRCLWLQRTIRTGHARGSPGCDITRLVPAGDTRAHDTRAATRGRRVRPDRGHIPARCSAAGAGMGRDGHPRGMLAHLRAPGYSKLRRAAGTEPWMEQRGPARGDGGTSDHGAPSATRVGAGMPTPCGKRHRERRRRHPLGQHAFASATGGGVGRETRSVRLSRLGRATLSRHGEAIKGHTEGFSVASEAGTESGGAPQQPLTAAYTAGGLPRAQDGRQRPGPPFRECSSFGRHLAARAVSVARCAAPRAMMLGQRSARGNT